MSLIAFYIAELPVNNTLQVILPEWIFLLTLYFAVSQRYQVNTCVVLLIGLLQDLFIETHLGIHGFIYVVCFFILFTIRTRFKLMAIPVQAIFVGALVFVKVGVLFLYNILLHSTPNHYWSFLSILTSITAWVGFYIVFSLAKPPK